MRGFFWFILLAAAIFAFAFALAGCASAGSAKDKVASLYGNLGKTTETMTSVTFNKDGTATTNVTVKVTTQSPAADFIKSVGGAALKGAK